MTDPETPTPVLSAEDRQRIEDRKIIERLIAKAEIRRKKEEDSARNWPMPHLEAHYKGKASSHRAESEALRRLLSAVDATAQEGVNGVDAEQGLAAGEVIDLDGRMIRISGMPDGSLCRDVHRRIAVRNVETDRLSYIPEWRLLRCPAKDAEIAKQAARIAALETALRDLWWARRQRHHGYMPDDVQRAYDNAWALLQDAAPAKEQERA